MVHTTGCGLGAGVQGGIHGADSSLGIPCSTTPSPSCTLGVLLTLDESPMGCAGWQRKSSASRVSPLSVYSSEY